MPLVSYSIVTCLLTSPILVNCPKGQTWETYTNCRSVHKLIKSPFPCVNHCQSICIIRLTDPVQKRVVHLGGDQRSVVPLSSCLSKSESHRRTVNQLPWISRRSPVDLTSFSHSVNPAQITNTALSVTCLCPSPVLRLIAGFGCVDVNPII